MAKKKVKVASVLDLSEKEVEVDDSGKIVPGVPGADGKVPCPPDLREEAWFEPKAPASAMQCRKIPAGYNKYTPTNEWLILILESLYRLEAKLGV